MTTLEGDQKALNEYKTKDSKAKSTIVQPITDRHLENKLKIAIWPTKCS